MKTDVTTTRSSDETLRCTQGSCSCQSYQPGQLRTCLDCRHGWVFHALDKLQTPAQAVCGGAQAEVVVPGVVFDLSSLVLFGAQAVPVRMKILLDRLLSVLPQQQVLHTLLPLGWTLRDYIRGYMLQDSTGRVLDRWLMLSQEEEAVILPHFLRFGETRPIVELMMQQDSQANHVTPSGVRPAPQTQSNLRAFIENSLRNPPPTSRTPGTLSKLQNSGGGSTSLHPLESLTSDLSWLLPLQLPSPSLLLDLTPPTRPGRVIRLGGDQNQGMGEVRKGRVSCTACGKSFYDKGTLKIHVSAVHLQVKHGCTVPGCSMLFSSLRSRNRHSANPNPRLLEFPPCDGIRRPPHSTPPPLFAPTPSVSTATSSSQSHKSFGSGGGAGAPQLAYQKGRCASGDPAPKKKPRKSSTPVKIAVTTGEGGKIAVTTGEG
ncbi:zinc finger protein basonuclin-1 [Osmerus eperlanus]|uniref:zinc finger protein basonuclin-1 n=1 Tax=Osmerus eperlanus TaxID=29151 RepID=UPI002E0D809B